jgi:hypothetical protein
MNAYGLDDLGSISGKGSYFSLLFNIHTGSVHYHPVGPVQWVPAIISFKVKWSEPEANHSLPSSAK